MKTTFFILLFIIFLLINAHAQSTYFNRNYDLNQIWEMGFAVLILPDSGYLMAGRASDYSVSPWKYYFFILFYYFTDCIKNY